MTIQQSSKDRLDHVREGQQRKAVQLDSELSDRFNSHSSALNNSTPRGERNISYLLYCIQLFLVQIDTHVEGFRRLHQVWALRLFLKGPHTDSCNQRLDKCYGPGHHFQRTSQKCGYIQREVRNIPSLITEYSGNIRRMAAVAASLAEH